MGSRFFFNGSESYNKLHLVYTASLHTLDKTRYLRAQLPTISPATREEGPSSQTLYEPGPGVSEPLNPFFPLEKREAWLKPQLGIDLLRERYCLPTVGGSV